MRARFEASVVRYVHDALTQESLNIGVVMLCREASWVGCRFLPSLGRVTAAFPRADAVHLRRLGAAIADACVLWEARLGELPLDGEGSLLGRLQAIAPQEESGVTFSATISGLTEQPERTLGELFGRYVERYVEQERTPPRGDEDVWKAFAEQVNDSRVLAALRPYTIQNARYENAKLELRHAWKNGRWNAILPLSLDLRDPDGITRKAAGMVGRIVTVSPDEQDVRVTLLVGEAPPTAGASLKKAAHEGFLMMKECLAGRVDVVEESRAHAVLEKLRRDVLEHGDEH